jgi:hypothetical protein
VLLIGTLRASEHERVYHPWSRLAVKVYLSRFQDSVSQYVNENAKDARNSGGESIGRCKHRLD